MREHGEDFDNYIERRITEALNDVKVSDIQQLPLAALRRWTEDQMTNDAVDSDNVTESVTHVGEVKLTARAAPPQGWLVCNGAVLPVANYTALHSAIGYTYGGAGANFNLPTIAAIAGGVQYIIKY